MTKTLESHTLTGVTRLIQISTYSSSSSSSLSSGINIFCISLFSRNFRFATLDLAACKKNRERSTNIGEVIMPRIRNGSGKDLVTKSKENGQNSVHLGAWDQEIEKLEMSLVPNTLWNEDGQESSVIV